MSQVPEPQGEYCGGPGPAHAIRQADVALLFPGAEHVTPSRLRTSNGLPPTAGVSVYLVLYLMYCTVLFCIMLYCSLSYGILHVSGSVNCSVLYNVAPGRSLLPLQVCRLLSRFVSLVTCDLGLLVPNPTV